MAQNSYISWNDSDEQNLYEELVIESLKFYGQDVYYIPRDIITEDEILNEALESRFNDFIEIEMYLETVSGFEGDGELFSKFGLEIRNEIKLLVSKMRFNEEVNNSVDADTRAILRPREGDLIYHATTKGLYQIKYVDNKEPHFFNLGNLPVYRLSCELFEYSGEDLDTGIDQIDDIQSDFSLSLQIQTSVSYSKGTKLTITSNDSPALTLSAEVMEIDASNNIRLSSIKYTDDYFMLIPGLSVTDGTSVGTVLKVYDGFLDSPSLPYEPSLIEDNEEAEAFVGGFIDDDRINPIGQV